MEPCQNCYGDGCEGCEFMGFQQRIDVDDREYAQRYFAPEQKA